MNPPVQPNEGRRWTIGAHFDEDDHHDCVIAGPDLQPGEEVEVTDSNALRERVEVLERERGRLKAEKEETADLADEKLAGDYADVLALAEVSVRSVERQANKLIQDAADLRKAPAGEPSGKVRWAVADRLEERAATILRGVQKPNITKFRQQRAGEDQNRHQLEKANRRAEAAESRVEELEGALGELLQAVETARGTSPELKERARAALSSEEVKDR